MAGANPFAPKPKRYGQYDPRYHSRRWRNLRLDILGRDLWRCRINGPRCLGRANQVDHILSPHPDIDGADFWDPTNLRAACGPCNNGRNAPSSRRFLSRGATDESALANLSPPKRYEPLTGDYSREKTDDGDSEA